jgi:hypothetical protein
MSVVDRVLNGVKSALGLAKKPKPGASTPPPK